MNIVKKYENYLIYQLMESIMVTSTKFKSLIKNMPANDKIADILYEIINDKKDIKTSYNLIEFAPDKNDEVQFLPDSQYQRFISKGDDLSSKVKSRAKIGRMVGQILKDNGYNSFTESDIEKFVNSFKSTWDKHYGESNRNIEIVKGDDILLWYREEKYNSKEGTLGNSCMRYSKVNHFMKIYAENPDKVSMVILTENDRLLGRALFWNLDKCGSNPKNKFYLDRIYTEKDSDVEFIWDWVFENLVKRDVSLLASHKVGDNHGMQVNLNKTSFTHYPYADSLLYLYEEVSNDGKLSGSGYMSNEKNENLSDNYVISEIRNHNGGTKSIFTHRYSKALDIYILKDDACYLDSDWYLKDMCRHCSYLDDWMLIDDAIWSECMKDWIPKSRAIEDKKYGIILPGVLIDVVIGFRGEYKSPLDAYIKIGNNDECIVESIMPKSIKRGEDYSVPGYRINEYRYYLNKLLKNDIWGNPQISETMIKIYYVGRYSTIFNKYPNLPIIENFSDAYITEDDSIIYDIEIDKNHFNYISIKSLFRDFTNIDYNKIMDKISTLNNSRKSSIIEFKEEINSYLTRNSTQYRTNQELYTKFKDVSSIEVHHELHNIIWNSLIENEYSRFVEYIKYNFDNYDINLTEEQIVIITKLMYILLYFYLNNDDGYESRNCLKKWINENKIDLSFLNSRGTRFDRDEIAEILRISFRSGIDDMYDSYKSKASRNLSEKYNAGSESIMSYITKVSITEFKFNIEDVKII